MGKKPEVKQAIALPYNTGHIEFVQKIKKSLDKLGIGIYWVAGDYKVTKE